MTSFSLGPTDDSHVERELAENKRLRDELTAANLERDALRSDLIRANLKVNALAFLHYGACPDENVPLPRAGNLG